MYARISIFLVHLYYVAKRSPQKFYSAEIIRFNFFLRVLLFTKKKKARQARVCQWLVFLVTVKSNWLVISSIVLSIIDERNTRIRYSPLARLSAIPTHQYYKPFQLWKLYHLHQQQNQPRIYSFSTTYASKNKSKILLSRK